MWVWVWVRVRVQVKGAGVDVGAGTGMGEREGELCMLVRREGKGQMYALGVKLYTEGEGSGAVG